MTEGERTRNNLALCKASKTGPEVTDAAYNPALSHRQTLATVLAHAIGDAHPDDARQLLTAALLDLSAGMPLHTAFGDVRDDARWWAAGATPVELMECLGAALRELGDKALHRTTRKQLFAVLWESFPEEDRRAFLARVDPQGQFRRRA